LNDLPPSDTLEFELDLDELASEPPPRVEPLCLSEAEAAPTPQAEPTPRAEPVAPPAAPPSNTYAAPPAYRPTATKRPPLPELPSPFAEIVAKVSDDRLRSLSASTLVRIMKLLDALRAVEEALTRHKVLTVGALFAGVRVQATSLLSYLTEAVVRGEGLDEEFREVLDGIRFVMAHEMGKVFSYEFPGLTDEGPSTFTRAELTRAWGLLHNCLQQTAITLARTIEPTATGQQLFEDYRSKTENSLTLYREMQLLLQKVKTAQKANGILLKHSLVRHLEHFREETMHFLMYKDWGEFGRFVDDVKRAFEEMEEFDCVLHGFAQYLSTLIHHVGMREVLSVRQAQSPASAAPRASADDARDPLHAQPSA
jgi:hypothetical protein